MSETNGVSHGVGGFGRWGNWLGHNTSLAIRHNKIQCTWKPANDDSRSSAPLILRPLILPPMPSLPHPNKH